MHYWLPHLFLLAQLHNGHSFEPAGGVTTLRHPNRPSSHLPLARTVSDAETTSDKQAHEGPQQTRCDTVRHTLRQLAQWSLEDYKWRVDIFRSNEADRQMEQSLAKLRGENTLYVRPMDADEAVIGPLGKWEKSTVEWLAQVIDEEGRRAKLIVNQDGKLIRPIELAGDLGPLGTLEQAWVDFVAAIQNAETERARTKTLRPMDVQESQRGPFGRLEEQLVKILREIRASEQVRLQQSRTRGGEMVRPIDVPGPLGEWELAVSQLFQAEKYRARQRKRNQGKIVRPKDASIQGPLGTLESCVYDIFKELSNEETERLRNIGKVLSEKRPMENDRNSLLGNLESLIVGLLRAPQLLLGVIRRVQELMASEKLAQNDAELIRTQTTPEAEDDNSASSDPR